MTSTLPESQLRAFLTDLPFGVSVYRLDDLGDPYSLRLTYGNAMAGRLAGLDIDAEVGRRLIEIAPALVETDLPERYAKVVHSGVGQDLGEIAYEDERIEAGIYTVRAIPLPDQSVGIAFENVTERRELDALRDAREALATAEERVRLAADSAGIGTWDFDPATQKIEWDARCYVVFGLPGDAEVDYDRFFSLLHPEDRARTEALVQAALDPAGTGDYDTSYRIVWPSGEVRWVQARGRALFEAEGAERRAHRFLGILRDVTDERATAHAAAAAEARTRALLNAASDIVLVYPVGPEGPGPFSDFNEAAVRRYGYSAEALGAMTILDLLGSRADAFASTLDHLVGEGEARFDAVHHTHAGERIPVETSARILELDGELIVFSISRDVSERRNFLRELARTNNALERRVAERTGALEERERVVRTLSTQLQSILDAAGDGIYGLDLDGNTTFMNPAAVAHTGWGNDESIGVQQHAQIHHHHADGSAYPREECPIYAVMRDGTPRTVTDEVFWRKDGTPFPVEYISTPLHEDGKISGAVVVFRPRSTVTVGEGDA